MTSRPPAMEWHRGYVTRGTRSCTRIKSPVNASWSNARFHAKMAISSICGALCILHSVSGQGARGNCCKYARYVERCVFCFCFCCCCCCCCCCKSGRQEEEEVSGWCL